MLVLGIYRWGIPGLALGTPVVLSVLIIGISAVRHSLERAPLISDQVWVEQSAEAAHDPHLDNITASMVVRWSRRRHRGPERSD